jgi:hypothetical protein
VPVEFGYLEGDNCDNANFSVSRLVKEVPCSCRCICNNAWSSINTSMRR